MPQIVKAMRNSRQRTDAANVTMIAQNARFRNLYRFNQCLAELFIADCLFRLACGCITLTIPQIKNLQRRFLIN